MDIGNQNIKKEKPFFVITNEDLSSNKNVSLLNNFISEILVAGSTLAVKSENKIRLEDEGLNPNELSKYMKYVLDTMPNSQNYTDVNLFMDAVREFKSPHEERVFNDLEKSLKIFQEIPKDVDMNNIKNNSIKDQDSESLGNSQNNTLSSVDNKDIQSTVAPNADQPKAASDPVASNGGVPIVAAALVNVTQANESSATETPPEKQSDEEVSDKKNENVKSKKEDPDQPNEEVQPQSSTEAVISSLTDGLRSLSNKSNNNTLPPGSKSSDGELEPRYVPKNSGGGGGFINGLTSLARTLGSTVTTPIDSMRVRSQTNTAMQAIQDSSEGIPMKIDSLNELISKFDGTHKDNAGYKPGVDKILESIKSITKEIGDTAKIQGEIAADPSSKSRVKSELGDIADGMDHNYDKLMKSVTDFKEIIKDDKENLEKVGKLEDGMKKMMENVSKVIEQLIKAFNPKKAAP